MERQRVQHRSQRRSFQLCDLDTAVVVAGTGCRPTQTEPALGQLIETLLMTFGFCLLVDGFLYIKLKSSSVLSD